MKKHVLFLVAGCIVLTAQTPQAAFHAGGPPEQVFDVRTLQEKYHIAPTQESLIGALQHQELVVRRFAASWLGRHADKAAIRPILAALAAETDESDKIILATSAARLGAAEGFDALKAMCE